jgi:hypothetical protein
VFAVESASTGAKSEASWPAAVPASLICARVSASAGMLLAVVFARSANVIVLS